MIVDDNLLAIWFVPIGPESMLALLRRCDGRIEFRYQRRRSHRLEEDDQDAPWMTIYAADIDPQEALARARSTLYELMMLTAQPEEEPLEMWELMRGDSTLEEFKHTVSHAPFMHARLIPLH